ESGTASVAAVARAAMHLHRHTSGPAPRPYRPVRSGICGRGVLGAETCAYAGPSGRAGMDRGGDRRRACRAMRQSWGASLLQARCEDPGRQQREPNACHARGPAEAIENLTQHGAADEAAEEIRGKVETA